MDNSRYIVQVFVASLSPLYEALTIEASKQTTADEIVSCISDRLTLHGPELYELAEVVGNAGGQECKERRLGGHEHPVALQMLWPRVLPPAVNGNQGGSNGGGGGYRAPEYRFCLREKISDGIGGAGLRGTSSVLEGNGFADSQLVRDYFFRFLYQPRDKEYPDLCQLPDLNETTLLQNLKARFLSGHIYTYVGSILIAVNPFQFYPIYNPKYVKLYQNRRLGDLPPHVFAVADAAYHTMLCEKRNQCIVISGESGSGKTESTNFLLHHLTALSQKGTHGSGVEQTILSAGPVLEAFGNAKTAHNNNSSRFGKFIQVNYKENGMVHGAVVQKYLLEKSRIVSQAKNERNYHVFYYLLAGSSQTEKAALNLLEAEEYHYLNQSNCYTLEGVDEHYEFLRLKQSMEMVGFSAEKQRRLFSVLSAVLLLGNVEFMKKSNYHHDEAVWLKNPDLVAIISGLLKVKEETLISALTSKRAKASGETLVINYRFPEAIAARDALAKCLYGALFDWIVLQVNHALLAKKDTREHYGNAIGVLDIFGFEDFGQMNSFEQFCINFANEHLQFYFNQHVFKYEQEEYKREGIRWKNIEFIDNTGCLQLIEAKPNGLLCILDDQCNFPGATNETLLQKFHNEHKENEFYEVPQKRETAFFIKHYAGKVKYQAKDFREKNLDLMRPDIVSVLKNSSMAFVRELVGADPVAVFRWAILRAFFRAYFAFLQAGQRYRNAEGGGDRGLKKTVAFRNRKHDGVMSPTKSPTRKSNSSRRPLTDMHGNFDFSKSYQQHIAQNRWSLNSGSVGQNDCSMALALDPSAPPQAATRLMNVNEARLLQRANRIMQKNKSFRPRTKSTKSLKNLQSMKTLAGKTQASATLSRTARKQPLTVSAQFTVSLAQLMETLNQARPFFVRCIKSNADKVPNRFDEEIILRQLRYTGMLETVRIRQSGYNVRLSFEEFIQLYRILLPRGLLSSQVDVRNFLLTMNLNRDNYQIGKTKLFMRESEKLKLDFRLHQAILSRIVTIQRWYRTILERRSFLRIRNAAVRMQAFFRRYLAQKLLATLRLQHCAALMIQKCWRGYVERRRYRQLRQGVIFIQSRIRGQLAREKWKTLINQRKRRSEIQITTNEAHLDSQTQNDEAFLSKESSQEDLDRYHQQHVIRVSVHPSVNRRECRDSEESSGIQDDSDAEPPRGHAEHHVVEALISPSLPSDERVLQRRLPANQHRPSLPCFTSPSLTPPMTPTSTTSSQDYSPPSGSPTASTLAYPSSPTKRDVYSHRESLQLDVKPLYADEKKTKLHKKLSLKRSKSAKASLASEAPPAVSKHKPEKDKRSRCQASPELDRPTTLRRGSRETKEPDEASNKSMDQCLNQPYRKIAFHRAKKHLKSIVLGKKWVSNVDGSDESGSEDMNGLSSLNSSLDSTVRTPDESISSLQRFEDRRSAERSADGDKEQVGNPYNNHKFKTTTKFSRGELCAYCSKAMSSLFTHGFRCSDCRQAFHLKCNQFAHKRACQTAATRRSPSANAAIPPPVARHHQQRRQTLGRDDFPPPNTWNVTRMSEFTDRSDKIISDVRELQNMDAFIFKKICLINEDGGRRDTIVDVVFKKALKEFKSNLISTYSVAAQDGQVSIKYKDLITNFEQVMENVCWQENTSATFPVTMGVNAFRGFLDEFMSLLRAEDKVKKEKAKKEKRKKEQVIAYRQLGHSFAAVAVNIPTVCEICSSFIWLMEKGLVCQNCKLTCHRKCFSKVTNNCREDQDYSQEGKVFGARLASLVTEDAKIPPFVDRLISIIEIKGLYSEGLYRKSGASSKVKLLKQAIENDANSVNFDTCAIHVLTSTLKAFLREMSEPLMTYESYDELIRATVLSEATERVSTLFSIINKLPKPNFDLTERLIFHLARVSQQEEFNRMSPNSLAIVFAPCVLRTNRKVNAQDSLNDVGKQTQCLEIVIQEQLHKLKSTLADIDTLDTACHSASNRLSSLRSSKVNLPKMYLPQDSSDMEMARASEDNADEEEEDILTQQIETLQNEKALLTTVLPTLARSSSDDEMLSTDIESSVGSLDDINHSQYEEYALTFDLPVSPPTLQHLTKHRAPLPQKRRLPTHLSLAEPQVLNFGEGSTASSRIVTITMFPPATIERKDDPIMV